MDNSWRKLTPGVATSNDVKRSLGAPETDEPDDSYGAVDHLRLMDYDEPQASIYLKSDRVWLIVVVPDEKDTFPEDAADWEKDLGKPPLKLPSREGKQCRTHVWAEKGMAATFKTGRLLSVELFAGMKPEEYQKQIYVAPPVFVK
jgi:hypothetical protein